MNQRSFSRAVDLMHRNAGDPRRPRQFRLLGLDWDLLDGVFSPSYTPVTELFTSWLPNPPGGTFLEIGSGAGVTAVVAARSGCRSVTALDISAAAVRNTLRNVERHGVADRVRVLRSDMFTALAPDERFDLIFWNSSFVEAPEGFVNETDLHHAFFDPQYRAHRTFVRDGPRHLSAQGRLLLGFSDLGNTALLRRLCAEAGLAVSVLRSQRFDLEVSIEFQLLELRPR
jgi:release factor glutamine methyltransferase